jgi:hypothetical protein
VRAARCGGGEIACTAEPDGKTALFTFGHTPQLNEPTKATGSTPAGRGRPGT